MGAWRWAPPLTLAAVVAAVGLVLLGPYGVLPPCLFRMLTGVPCPSCGGTHCALALASLDLPRAFACNPLAALIAVGLVSASVLNAVERLLRRPLLSPAPILRRPAILRALAAGLALANWAYLIAVAASGG